VTIRSSSVRSGDQQARREPRRQQRSRCCFEQCVAAATNSSNRFHGEMRRQHADGRQVQRAVRHEREQPRKPPRSTRGGMRR